MPFGLNGVKITLDGDRDMHNRMRPLRGGPGHLRQDHRERAAGRRQVPHRDRRQLRRIVGGQLPGAARLPDARRTSPTSSRKVSFKPIIREQEPAAAQGHHPAHRSSDRHGKPLNGTCMTSAGSGHVGLRQLQLPRREDVVPARGDEEARLQDRRTACTWARARFTRTTRTRSAPTASLYACPGFTGDGRVDGHIDGRGTLRRAQPRRSSRSSSAWKECNDCAFIPVCAGGCTVATTPGTQPIVNQSELSQEEFRAGSRGAGV